MKNLMLCFLLLGLTAGCASQSRTVADSKSDFTGSRFPAQAATTETPVDMAKAIDLIQGGAAYEISCHQFLPNAQTHQIKVTITQPGANDHFVISTGEGAFAENLRNASRRTYHSGDYMYSAPVDSLYYTPADKKRVRLVDVRSAIFSSCVSPDASDTTVPAGVDYYVESSNQLVSLVGPYASVKSFLSSYTGGAHDLVSNSISAMNANDVKVSPTNINTIQAQPVSLTSLVTPDSLTAALKADPFMKKRLGAKLARLSKLEDIHTLMKTSLGDGCDLYVPDTLQDAFSGFAIFDYPVNGNKSKLAVRLTYGYACEAMRGNLTELGLVVTPTPQFEALLNAETATAQQENRKPYFMKYLLKAH